MKLYLKKERPCEDYYFSLPVEMEGKENLKDGLDSVIDFKQVENGAIEAISESPNILDTENAHVMNDVDEGVIQMLLDCSTEIIKASNKKNLEEVNFIIGEHNVDGKKCTARLARIKYGYILMLVDEEGMIITILEATTFLLECLNGYAKFVQQEIQKETEAVK